MKRRARTRRVMDTNPAGSTSEGLMREAAVDTSAIAREVAIPVSGDDAEMETSSQIASSGQCQASALVLPPNPINIRPVRIPYNNGYGDYCFFRGDDQYLGGYHGGFKKLRSNQQKLDEEHAKSIQVPEMDGFERFGVFSYSKLPLEIRSRILRLVLDPLYLECEETGKKYMSFSFSLWSGWKQTCYEVDFNHFWQSWIELRRRNFYNAEEEKLYHYKNEFTNTTVLSAIGLRILECQFEKERAAYIHEIAPYPNRIFNYEIDISMLGGPYGSGRAFLQWIRQLANVSNIFRLELGDALWSNSKIAVYDVGELSLIPKILKERPRAWRAIKHLSLGLCFEEIELRTASKIFESIAGKLELDSLRLRVEARMDDLEDITQGIGISSALKFFRKVNVKREFLIFPMTISRIFDEESGEMFAEQTLIDVYRPQLLELMMPDTLRTQDLPTKIIDAYLSNRL